MKTFFKVLLGDVWNAAVVAVIVLAAVAMVRIGYAGAAVILVPALTLGGVALLTRR